MSLRDEAVDASFRAVYRVGHRVLRVWWAVRHPKTQGVLVALWYGGELLLVKNSYRREYTLPGGFVRDGETIKAAGARELLEETGIRVAPDRLSLAYHGTHRYEGREDMLDILETNLEELPPLRVDGREVVWAGFRAPARARLMSLVPHLEDYLADK